MRLYPYPDPVPAVDAPEGHFEPGDDGGFDFPDTLFTRLHSTHHDKEKRWETANERQQRTRVEDRDRRRDPETLYNAVAEIAAAARGQAQPSPDVLAEIAALRAELAELRAASVPASADGDDSSEDAGAEPPRERKTRAPKADPAE